MKRSSFFSLFLVLLSLFANSVIAAEQKRTLTIKNRSDSEARFAYWYAVDPEDVDKIGEVAGYHVRGWVHVPSGHYMKIDIPKTSYVDLGVAGELSNGTVFSGSFSGSNVTRSGYYLVHPEKNFKIVQDFGSGEILSASAEENDGIYHKISKADTKQINFYRYRVPNEHLLQIPGNVSRNDFDGNYDRSGFVRTGTDYALLFATDMYTHWNNLNTPIADAKTIGAVLENRYGFNVDIRENLTIRQILVALAEYNKKEYAPGDQLLVYFTGHGYFDATLQEGHIAGTESQLPETDVHLTTYLSYSRLKSALNNFPCKRIIVILDVSYGGTFDANIALDKALDKAPSRYHRVGKEKRNQPQLDLAETLKAKTRWYLSAGGKEPVQAGIEHSPFTSALLQILNSSDEILADGVLTIPEIERQLPSKLESELDRLRSLDKESEVEQTPASGPFGSPLRRRKITDQAFVFIQKDFAPPPTK